MEVVLGNPTKGGLPSKSLVGKGFFGSNLLFHRPGSEEFT